jgi:hypothetical protein
MPTLVVEGGECLTHPLDVLLRHRLLPQTGGFEGLGVAEPVAARQVKTVPAAQDYSVLRIDWDAPLGSTPQTAEPYDHVVRLADLSCQR